MIYKFGYWAGIFTSAVALFTFGIAIFTPPLSGPLCTGNCYSYPYLDIASRFPRDYFWMYPAMLLTLMYYVLISTLHYLVPPDKKFFSHLSVSFGLISTSILLVDYFLQISVIQPSIIQGETDGISFLTQYNAHGIFIALEEIGFIMMSLSFLFLTPIFSRKVKIEKILKWIFLINFVLTILSFTLFSFLFGIMREYRFEVAVISINWLTLIISGFPLSLYINHLNKVILSERK